jgi:hypothetical protein
MKNVSQNNPLLELAAAKSWAKIRPELQFNMRKIVSHKSFAASVDKLKRYLKGLDCPVPSKGFTKGIDFEKWKSTLNGILYTQPTTYWREKLIKIEEDTPLRYFDLLRWLMVRYGLDPEDKDQVSFIEGHVFFSDSSIFLSMIEVKNDLDEQGRPRLWLLIPPWMRKNDLAREWSKVVKLQLSIYGSRKKNRPYARAERDIELHNAQQKASRTRKVSTRVVVESRYVDNLKHKLDAGQISRDEYDKGFKKAIKNNPEIMRTEKYVDDRVEEVAAKYDMTRSATRKALSIAKKRGVKR